MRVRFRKLASVGRGLLAVLALWTTGARADDQWKDAIVFDSTMYTIEGLNPCPRPGWPYKTLDMSDPDNRAYCATLPPLSYRLDRAAELTTAFGLASSCAGIHIVVFNDQNKVSSPSMMRAKLASNSWWLWINHAADLRPGQIHWSMKGGLENGEFDGFDIPNDAADKICKLARGKGGLVSPN